MHPKLPRQLGDRPVPSDRRQRHLRLEPRIMFLPCPLHILLPRYPRVLGAGLHLSLLSHFRGPPQPVFAKSYFRILKDEFSTSSDIVTISSGGKPVASVLNFYFRDEVLPFYGGGIAAARQLAANDFMYWEVMRRACERGYRIFDFGRSKIGPGSYAFKCNWGFHPSPLIYQFRLAPGRSMPG